MFIMTEPTPNPAVLKFLPGRTGMEAGSREFPDAASASASPLAGALFGIKGVTRVFFAEDFLTVSKEEAADWSHLKAPILAAIMDHYTAGGPIVSESAAEASDGTIYDAAAAQVVQEIKDLLDSRIRPAVAQDGGDITFDRFEPDTGVVWLHMRGACAGCPSSAATLKSGVENLMRHYIPEVTAVEQVL